MRRNGEFVPLILYCVSEDFRRLSEKPSSDLVKNASLLNRCMRIADTNGLLYPFLKGLTKEFPQFKNCSIISTTIKNEEESLSLLTKTLATVSNALDRQGIEFLFIKLYRKIPYSPRDIDVLIHSRDFNQAVSTLKSIGFETVTSNPVETKCAQKGFLNVDLYSGFYYMSMKFMNDSFLWDSPRSVRIADSECMVPNAEADLLSLILHSLLGHRRISLLDFLYAVDLIDNGKLDMYKLVEQAEKYHWKCALKNGISTIKSLKSAQFGTSIESNCFPFIYPTSFVLKSFGNFHDFHVTRKRLISFILSAFLDGFYHEYLTLGQSMQITIPEPIKVVVGKGLFASRQKRGDRKTTRSVIV